MFATCEVWPQNLLENLPQLESNVGKDFPHQTCSLRFSLRSVRKMTVVKSF